MFREQYVEYLRTIYRQKDGDPLSESSIAKYSGETLTRVNVYISKNHIENLHSIFDVVSLQQLNRVIKRVLGNEDFMEMNRRGNNMYSAGLNRYLEFASGILFANHANELKLLDKPIKAKKGIIVRESSHPDRDRIIINQVINAVNYTCEVNPDHQTFIATATQKPYIEGHHIIPLSCQQDFSNSLDVYANILVLCPNCHRLFHYGDPDKSDRKKLLNTIFEAREERFFNAGISVSRNEFLDLTLGQSDSLYT